MFLTGPGGSGKSKVIEQTIKYAEQFCDYLGVPFNEKTILVTAMSGVAATIINGETIHRAVHLRYKLHNITEAMIDAFEEVRMLIIDEISFADTEDIRKLHKVLMKLKQNYGEEYGGMDIIFMGDFLQIPSVGGTKLYQDDLCIEWHQWINCFIELKGMWRFKDDPEYGKAMMRLREGHQTPDDFELINSRCLQSKCTFFPWLIFFNIFSTKPSFQRSSQ